MASETTAPEHSAVDPVEEKMADEIKEKAEEVSVSKSKEDVGKDDQEKLKVEEPLIAETVVTETGEKAKDDTIEVPAVEVEKVEEGDKPPVSDVSINDSSKMECSEQKAVESAAPETAVEVVEKELDEPSKIPDVPESSIEAVIKEAVDSSPVPPAQEPELEVGKEPEEAAAAVTEVLEKAEESTEIPTAAESVPEIAGIPEEKFDVSAEEKPVEQSEVAIVKESVPEVIEVDKTIEIPDIKESTEVKIPKDEVALADKAEVEIEPAKEEPSMMEKVSLAAASDKIEEEVIKVEEKAAPQNSGTASAGQEVPDSQASAETAEDDKVKETVEPENIESVEDTKKEQIDVGVVEGLVKAAVVEAGLPDPSIALSTLKEIQTTSVANIAENLVKSNDNVEEEKEEKKEKIEESAPLEMAKIEDVSGSDSVNEVTKSSFEGEKASRDVEIVADDKKKETVTVIPSSVEASKESGMDEATGISKEKELEVKAEETIQSNINQAAKVEEKKEVAVKDGAPVEPPKDRDDSKPEADNAKQEVIVKTTHRQSNNIISKVKQSIVKVKKAITGKSPSSKTLGAKGDIKVK